jgi:hypothetical protein
MRAVNQQIGELTIEGDGTSVSDAFLDSLARLLVDCSMEEGSVTTNVTDMDRVPAAGGPKKLAAPTPIGSGHFTEARSNEAVNPTPPFYSRTPA